MNVSAWLLGSFFLPSHFSLSPFLSLSVSLLLLPPLVYRALGHSAPLHKWLFFSFFFSSLPLRLVVPVTLSLNVLRSIPPLPRFFLASASILQHRTGTLPLAPPTLTPHSLPPQLSSQSLVASPILQNSTTPPIHSSAGLSDIDPAHSHASKEANNLHSLSPTPLPPSHLT